LSSENFIQYGELKPFEVVSRLKAAVRQNFWWSLQGFHVLGFTIRGLQILDLIFDDTDPFAEDLSVIRDGLQQKRYWTLRQNPKTPLNALHRWFIPSTIVATVANSDLYFA